MGFDLHSMHDPKSIWMLAVPIERERFLGRHLSPPSRQRRLGESLHNSHPQPKGFDLESLRRPPKDRFGRRKAGARVDMMSILSEVVPSLMPEARGKGFLFGLSADPVKGQQCHRLPGSICVSPWRVST